MTIKGLYEWAVKNNAENFDIEVCEEKSKSLRGYLHDYTLPIITERTSKYNTETVVLLFMTLPEEGND